MKQTLAALIALIPIADATLAQGAQPQGRKIDCYCTDTVGDRHELGEEICLFVDGRAFVARCEMSLNNPMWREKAEGCPGASLIRDDGGDVFGVLLE